jgi:hypothetical protein
VNERPIRTVSQLAAALAVTDARAELLLTTLELMGVAEAGGGYRATDHAWQKYRLTAGLEQAAA